MAHSSAVEVGHAASSGWATKSAVAELLAELDGMLRWASKLPQSKRLCHVFEEARTMLAKNLS